MNEAHTTVSPAQETQAPPMPARADQWANDLRQPIALIRQNATVLHEWSESALGDLPRQAVVTIEKEARHLDRLLKTLESVDPPASTVGSMTRQAPCVAAPSPSAILVADDDDDVLQSLGDLLSDRYRLTFARDGGEAVAALRLWPFDLAIIDVGLPVVDGFKLVKAMRGADELPSSAVLFLSGQSEPKTKVRALSLGAADYVTKPFDSDELLARVARILAAVAREASLRADAMIDSLTGLANHRSFSQSLDREVERSRRYKLPLSLLTIDLDHLKAINDQHGHDAGGDAIRLTARVLARAVRKFELVARQGGDEFAVILPSTGASDALVLAERVRAEIAVQMIRGARLTVSIGAASLGESCPDAATLVKASDEALYRAKRAGRDRVEAAPA